MIDFAALRARNAPLNAFLAWDEGAAAGTGALRDITIGIKANIMVRGLPFHGGIGALSGRIASRDAASVAALRREGAAILGTLNMEEAALGSKSDNPHFGAVHNPHRIGYSPGGSSGGSAAAVAAGLCDASLGTDTMGSVRIPAAHCGVYGFKPAGDRVSQGGLDPVDRDFDAIGPIARDLHVLERVARVISEFGEGDLHGAGAVLIDHGVEIDPQVEAAFAGALEWLPGPPASFALPFPAGRIRYAGFIKCSRTLAALLAEQEGLSDHLAQLLTYGPRRAPGKWEEDQQVLAETREQMRAIVAQHGFVIMPTVPNAAFPHAASEPAAQADFTCLANIASLPAISLPMGWTDTGLPIGVQIIAQPGSEAGLFALARHLDTKLGAYRAPFMKGAMPCE